MTLVEEPNSNPGQAVLTKPKLLLPWDEQGLLPFKQITMNAEQLVDSPFVSGYGSNVRCWDSKRRLSIARDLIECLKTLSLFGIHEAIVGGEFVERVAEPASAEGYFRLDGDAFKLPQLQEFLATVEPCRSWAWFPSGDASSEPLVRLYPVLCYRRKTVIEIPPVALDYFHKDSSGKHKGVIQLVTA